MVNKLLKHKTSLVIAFAFILLSVFIVALLLNNKENKISTNLYETTSNTAKNSSISKNTADIKDTNDESTKELDKVNSNTVSADKNVVTNKPIIKVDNKIKNNEYIEVKEETNNTVEFKKNSEIIGILKVIILNSVSEDWYLSGSSIIEEPELIDKKDEYLLFDDIDFSVFESLKSGNIKIYAVDEYLNGKFIRTRCYIQYN